MLIKIENTVLQEALRVISRLAPPVSGNIVIKVENSKAWIVSSSQTSRCVVNLAAEVSGDQIFSIGLATLRDATKGRKQLEISYDKTLCKIKSANYKCELATVDALEVDIGSEIKAKKSIKLTGDQAQWLKQAISTVALKPNPLLSTFLPVAIKLTNKSAFVATYDNEHMAYVSSKEIQGDMSLVLPLETMQAVLDVFHIGAFKLDLDESDICVSNKLVKVWLSLPQDEASAIGLDDVVNQAKEASKADGKEMELDKQQVLEFLDNARAVATKERSEVVMITEPGKLSLSVETTNGSIKTVLKAGCKAKLKARINFDFMDEAIRKCEAQAVMKLVDDSFILFKMKDSSVIVSLNQE